MPKNKGKGGKNRRRGKNENEGLKRELIFKEDGQEYAQVCQQLNQTKVIFFHFSFCFNEGGRKKNARNVGVREGGICWEVGKK